MDRWGSSRTISTTLTNTTISNIWSLARRLWQCKRSNPTSKRPFGTCGPKCSNPSKVSETRRQKERACRWVNRVWTNRTYMQILMTNNSSRVSAFSIIKTSKICSWSIRNKSTMQPSMMETYCHKKTRYIQTNQM